MIPTVHELLRMSLIASVLCIVALGAAFAGAGITAFAVLALVVGPLTILLYRAFGERQSTLGDRDPQRSPQGV